MGAGRSMCTCSRALPQRRLSLSLAPRECSTNLQHTDRDSLTGPTRSRRLRLLQRRCANLPSQVLRSGLLRDELPSACLERVLRTTRAILRGAFCLLEQDYFLPLPAPVLRRIAVRDRVLCETINETIIIHGFLQHRLELRLRPPLVLLERADVAVNSSDAAERSLTVAARVWVSIHRAG